MPYRAAMTPIQSRMARAALGWSLSDLAGKAKLGRATLARFELGQAVNAESVAKARAALEAEGVLFVDRGQYRGGVVAPGDGR